MANNRQGNFGYEFGDSLDLIAPDEAIAAEAFSLWAKSGTSEGHVPDDASESGEHGDKPERPPRKKEKRSKKIREEHVPSVDEYPDLVEIDDLDSLIASVGAPGDGDDLVGFDFGTPDANPPAEQEDDGYDWRTDYYGKDEVEEEEEQEELLADGYSSVAGRDALDSFFGNADESERRGKRRRGRVPRPSAQSKVRTILKTPLASDFDEDDDYDDEDDGYVSLFEVDVNDRPFSVRSLGRGVSHRMTTTLQRFLDGNVNLGTQISALWKGFPEAYGIDVGRQRYSGFAMRPTRSILTGTDFGEARHMSVARVQSFDTFVHALADGDPYAIEFFGITPENLLYADTSAKTVLAYADAFMSKRIGQAALSTVVDLIRLIGRPAEYDVQFGHDRRARAIRAIDVAKEDFTEAYGRFAKIYVDVQNYDGKPTVMASMRLNDMPISEMADFSSTLADIARGYGMMAEVRGRSALRKEQLAYTMTEVVRILQTTSELLDGEGLHVFRDRKVHTLNGIMHGRLIGPDDRPIREFWEIVDEEQLRLEDAIARTEMPDDPDERMIERLIASQNRRTILQDA